MTWPIFVTMGAAISCAVVLVVGLLEDRAHYRAVREDEARWWSTLDVVDTEAQESRSEVAP